MVAVIGQEGVGKTTLCDLINRGVSGRKYDAIRKRLSSFFLGGNFFLVEDHSEKTLFFDVDKKRIGVTFDILDPTPFELDTMQEQVKKKSN